MSDLLNLAERVEAATGPDHELERDVALALGWEFLATDDDDEPFAWHDPDGAPQEDGFPDFLSSLDAAMTLADDDEITDLLYEAMERLGQNGWQEGRYKDRLVLHFTAACLRARVVKDPA